MIALIAVSLSWRWVFIIFGLAGLIWAVCWFFIYNVPAKNRFVTNKEKEHIEESIALQEKIESRFSIDTDIPQSMTHVTV